MDLNKEDIDIMKDRKLIEVPIILQGKRADGTAIDNEISIHNAMLYQNSNGKFYYIFEFITGRSVINFIPEDYKELEKIIPISEITIFQMTHFSDKDDLTKVSFEYR
jgi:hypothetical protein